MKKTLLIFLILILACSKDNTKKEQASKSISIWQKVELIKDTLDVKIPIEGKLMAWQKIDLISPLHGKVISLIVQPDDFVNKGDLLLHLWPLSKLNQFTPIEIFAPMNGIVTKIYIHLNDSVKKGDMLLTIENRQNLTLKAKVNSWQIPYIYRNANVILFYDSLQINGAVIDIDRNENWLTIIIPNQQLKLTKNLFVNGYVYLNHINGDFLPLHLFAQRDSVLAELGSDLTITLYEVGVVDDSLALITPSLPDVDEIQIKKNLDFIK